MKVRRIGKRKARIMASAPMVELALPSWWGALPKDARDRVIISALKNHVREQGHGTRPR